jgi:cytochrome c-type biogenesis protein CcmH/NrfF
MPKRLLQLAVILLAAFTMLGAGAPSASRFNTIGHKLMCVCGCGQILLECNHVGCPDSDREITELRAQLTAGASDAAIFNWFTTKYGPTVLAAPIRGGFDNVAWIAPFAALLAGIIAVVLLLRTWKKRQLASPALASTNAPDAESDALRDKIRRETNYGD